MMKTVMNDVIQAFADKDYQWFGIEESDKTNTYLKLMKNEDFIYARVSNNMPVKIKTFSEEEYLDDRMKRNLKSIARRMNANPNTPTVTHDKYGRKIK